MIYFLYGEDSYRSQKKLEEIIAHYKEAHKSGLNLIVSDVKEHKNSFEDFYSNLRVNSMFAEKKLIILKNIFQDKDFQEEFLKEIKSLEGLKNIIIVFEKDSVDERNKLFKTLKKVAKFQKFNLLAGGSLLAWLDRELENCKAKIDPMAKNAFLNCTGNNLWLASNEIKKMADFKAGKLIKKEDVELMMRPKIENDIFKTIDALASKNKKQALALLHKHLDSGDSALYLLSMIAYQFRNFLIIKELIEKGSPYANIAKKSGLHPFVIKKNYYLCNQFSLPQLKKIYQKIFLIDSSIKTGKVDAETALDLLISEI
ncbi:MAG: DNA polymerase III subunit delta [Patescibacteria group bacterium]